MYPHHADAIRRTTDHFGADPSVRALLLGGSIAHGFHSAQSDVDVMMVVSEEDYRTRLQDGLTCFFSRELCSYEGGYVDGKYVSENLLRQVAEKGSEPARFAFKDARVLFDREGMIAPLVAAAARYPTERKARNLWRFQAQCEAWYWYAGEALKRNNLPLLRTAVSKLTLFGGRIVLAHNELLYPYHKWFLRVLESAPEKPDGLMTHIETMARTPTPAALDQWMALLRGFKGWEISHATWPAQFMEDSELNWLSHPAPVDDV